VTNYNATENFWLIFQTGNSYIGNDYDKPSPKLELSRDWGSSNVFTELYFNLDPFCLEHTDISDWLEENKTSTMTTGQDFLEMYHFIDDLAQTVDINDYDFTAE
jgi:hypothetical protein